MITPLAERLEKRARLYDPFRDKLTEITDRITKGPVETWWFTTARSTLALLRRPSQLPPESSQFVQKYASEVLQTLQEASREQVSQTPAQQAVQILHRISDQLQSNETIEGEPIPVRHIPLEQLPKMSNRFSFTTKTDADGTSRRYLTIYSINKSTWFDYPLPQTEGVLHKGGLGRTILKVLYGSSSIAEPEFPPNDMDYIILDTEDNLAEAKKLNADPDGIERVHELDIPTLFSHRDLTLNCAFVGKDELFYSDDAKQSAETGKIQIISAKRGIYGSEKFVYQGTVLYKNRGLMRYLKTVAEGKARSFDLTPLNTQVDLGVYWLILAKRFSGKPTFPVLANRLYELAKKIGQVPPDSVNIYDVLDRVHTEHSYYNFAGKPLDEVGVARWLSKKLSAQIRRKYREELSIPSDADFRRTPGDTVPFEVHLDDYQINPPAYRHFLDNWPGFLSRCQRRTEDYLHSIQKP